MTPRPAAALALVGWYLMVPPPKPPEANDADVRAPLSHWMIYGVYDYGECQKAAADLREHAPRMVAADQKANPQKNATAASLKGEIQSLRAGQCIATNDPRLKEK